MASDNPLSRLLRKADSVAERATDLVARAARSIRGEISLLVRELDCATHAADRAKVEQMIRKRMAALSKRLSALMETQNELAAKSAAKSAGAITGMEVKYSPRRAQMICELATASQGENLAAVFTDKMSQNAITALRNATVRVLRQNAVEGGTLKSMTRALDREWQRAASSAQAFLFKDAGGHLWDTRAYMQMNVRTNAMRIYNDCLVDDIAQSTGGDLVRVSRGGDPNCRLCSPWEGVILSVSGKTAGFPTYEQARKAGLFHPNCTHTLEYVDETVDAAEIALQKSHPVKGDAATDPDAADERRYAIDQARYRAKGLSPSEARIEVDRDNLAESIRHGLLSDRADAIVSTLTDAQVSALCPNGNPPRFEVTKKGETESYHRGSRGGVVHVAKDADARHVLDVCGVVNTEENEFTFTGVAKKIYDRAKDILLDRISDDDPITLPKLDKDTVAEITTVSGHETVSDTPTIGNQEIIHTFKRHGLRKVINGRKKGEKSKNQVPITQNDFALIPEIITHYDTIENGSYCETDGMDSIKFCKTFDDGTTYAVFVLAETLKYKTMWKKKRD